MKKNFQSRSKGFKIMTLVLAFVLVIGGSIAGTLAWLTATTASVTNTFTAAELFAKPDEEFTLWEHEAVAGTDGTYSLGKKTVPGNAYEMLPGVNIPKDPTVDVENLLEHAYLYIKVTDTLPDNVSTEIDDANWTALTGYSGVYVYSGEHAEEGSNVIQATEGLLGKKSFEANIIKDKKIVVEEDYDGSVDGEGKWVVEAYMVQATGNGDSAVEAWENTYGKVPQTPATP